MDNKIKKLIKDSVLRLINHTISDAKIKKIAGKHKVKTHFIPARYRIFGGLLQSLNIQFGNFIEVMMQNIIGQESHLEIISDISGKKNVLLSISGETDSLIDRFITERQNNNDNKLGEKFSQLLENIVVSQRSDENIVKAKHDVDILFLNKKSGVYYYMEVKYDDNHDTGKFVDINRKFIKTYAGLVKKLNVADAAKLKPIIYYLTRKIMKGNIYVPEETHIYRGEKFFNEFLTSEYDDLDAYLTNVSEDKEIVEIFDKLYKKIRYETQF